MVNKDTKSDNMAEKMVGVENRKWTLKNGEVCGDLEDKDRERRAHKYGWVGLSGG